MEKLKGYYNNINLYKKYKMFSYDLLFYNAVSVLFFTITKGFSMAEVMYMTAAFSLFAFIWQIPSNFLIEKLALLIGKGINKTLHQNYIPTKNK